MSDTTSNYGRMQAMPSAAESRDLTGIRVTIAVDTRDANGEIRPSHIADVDPRCFMMQVGRAPFPVMTIQHIDDCSCGHIWPGA